MIRKCIILAAVTLSTAKPFKCPGLVLYYLAMEIIKSYIVIEMDSSQIRIIASVTGSVPTFCLSTIAVLMVKLSNRIIWAWALSELWVTQYLDIWTDISLQTLFSTRFYTFVTILIMLTAETDQNPERPPQQISQQHQPSQQQRALTCARSSWRRPALWMRITSWATWSLRTRPTARSTAARAPSASGSPGTSLCCAATSWPPVTRRRSASAASGEQQMVIFSLTFNWQRFL